MDMIRQRRATWLGLAGTLLGLAACSSDVEPSGAGGEGGGSTSTATTATTSTTSSSSSTGEGGGSECTGTEAECTCVECEAEGGTCLDGCNNSPTPKQCYFPGEPAEGEYSCGGAVNCADDEICVRGTPMGDGCNTYDCAPLPAACADDPTCTCVEGHIADPFFEPSCEEEDGHVTVYFPGGTPDPPFVEGEVCGEIVCDEGEFCLSCEDPKFPEEFTSHHCVVAEVPEGSFRCGTTTCLAGLESCEHDAGFEPCSDSYACAVLPDCPDPCDCIDLVDCPNGTCSQDADGNVFVECEGK